MKIAIALLSLSLTANVFAYSLTDSTVLTGLSPLLTTVSTSGGLKQDAAKIVNDAQELMQSGKMSTFLGQKIKEVQEIKDVSEAEALDLLVNESVIVLEN